MRDLPVYKELHRLYREVAVPDTDLIELLPGLQLSVQADYRYLNPAATQQFIQKIEKLNQDLQESEAKSSPDSKSAANPTASSKPDKASEQRDFALILAPDLRWKAKLYFIDGHLSKDQHLDAAAILESAKSRRYFNLAMNNVTAQLKSISLKWILPPQYDKQAEAYLSAESVSNFSEKETAIYYLLPAGQKTLIAEIKWQGYDANDKIQYYLDEVRQQLRQLKLTPEKQASHISNQVRSLSAHEIFAGPSSAGYQQFQQGITNYLKREETKKSRLRSELFWSLLPILFFFVLMLFSNSKQNPS